MWIPEIPKEILDKLIREGECMHLATGLDGKIYGASDSFCDWSGYTLWELQQTQSWIRMSVDDKNLEADKIAVEEMRRGERREYQVEKQYVVKSGTPHWGLLHVRRVPEVGEFQFCWCSWTPFRNGTAAAFDHAVKTTRALELQIVELAKEMKVLTTRTDEENFVVSMQRMVMRYPKLALTVLAIAGSAWGLDTLLAILSRTGYIPVPVQIEKVEHSLAPRGQGLARGLRFDESMREDPDGDEQTGGQVVFVSRNGNAVALTTSADRSVFRATECGERRRGGYRERIHGLASECAGTVTDDTGREDSGIGGMRSERGTAGTVRQF